MLYFRKFSANYQLGGSAAAPGATWGVWDLHRAGLLACGLHLPCCQPQLDRLLAPPALWGSWDTLWE